MSKLSESIISQLLQESFDRDIIVVYPGRFQPFHRGHYFVYSYLVKMFGKDNVYIGTSNKIEKPKSPFSFNEKKRIITKMFNVPSNRVVQIKNPYSPVEILSKFDKESAFVTAISSKDASRLGGKYYSKYRKDIDMLGYEEAGYYVVVPTFKLDVQGQNISGTVIRSVLGSDLKDDAKKELFRSMYGKLDSSIYNLIVNKLTEGYEIEQIYSSFVKDVLSEVSYSPIGSNADVDDGPNYFFGNYKSYKSMTARRAGYLGYTVLDYLIDEDEEGNPDWAIYPTGPVGDVSFAPTGVAALGTANERKEHTHLEGIGAFTLWDDHVRKIALMLGYELIDYLDARRVIDDVSTDAYDELVKRTSEEIHGVISHLDEGIIMEGGVKGHMNHPFDDMNLTFGDLKTLVTLSLQGKLDVEEEVVEKLDGQAIAISWKNGKLIAARNKGQIKNFGENAPDAKGIEIMFSGRGELSNAFSYAIRDLESSISKMSKKQKNDFFDEGRIFMNVEILYSSNKNVIPYGVNMLVFHGTTEYDKDGNAVGSGSVSSAKKLSSILKKINADVQKTFTIVGPTVVTLPKSKDYSRKRKSYISKINRLQKQFNLSDSSPVIEWHESWWRNFISSEASKNGYSITNNVLDGLIKRWAYQDKSYSINNIKKDIEDSTFKEWVLKYDKKSHVGQFIKNIQKFERIFLQLGADVLKNAQGFIAASPNKMVQSIQKDLGKAIAELSSSTDVNKISLLKRHLQRLEQVGGMKAIVPSEGIVFIFKGKRYKLTGSFAPVNQILGMLRYL